MTAVLLINADMTPMHTVSLQRAISLISKSKVDVVETIPDRTLRSPSVTWPFPSVLRLRQYRNVPRRKMIWSRRGVFARDNYTCQYCGVKLSREDATIDHIIPVEVCRSKGIRSSTWSNCICSCERCNRKKANRTMHDAGMKFFNKDFEPKIPRTNYLIVTSDVRPEWKVYLRT